MIRLEGNLQVFEKENISQRRGCESREYLHASKESASRKRQDVITKMSTCAWERWFMLAIKAKLAGQ